MPAGVAVSDLTDVGEGYSLRVTDQGYSLFTVNVSADRFRDTYLGLAKQVRAPGFAVIEVPTNARDEDRLRTSGAAPFHRDVYYLDGITFETYCLIFEKYSQLLIDDGGTTFGFGSHQGYDEVFVGKYKVVSIFADMPERYVQALELMGYRQQDRLRTVLDNITPETPGEKISVTVDGKRIYDVIEELLHRGFYLAERRKDT